MERHEPLVDILWRSEPASPAQRVAWDAGWTRLFQLLGARPAPPAPAPPEKPTADAVLGEEKGRETCLE